MCIRLWNSTNRFILCDYAANNPRISRYAATYNVLPAGEVTSTFSSLDEKHFLLRWGTKIAKM